MFRLIERSAWRVRGCPGRSLLQMAFSSSLERFRLVLRTPGSEWGDDEERGEGGERDVGKECADGEGVGSPSKRGCGCL